MENELTRGATARRKTEAVNDVVKTHLKHLQQVLAGDAFLAESLLEEPMELQLAHAVLTAQALLLAELAAVFGHLLGTATDVHTGSSGTLLDRALGHIATRALEEELLPFAAALTTNGTSITTHD